MKRKAMMGIVLLLSIFFFIPSFPAGAQSIENELYLITPVSQDVHEPVKIPKKMWDEIPTTIGKPVGLPLKDPKGFWVGTTLEPYGLIYQPKLLKRMGVEIQDWDDLLQPKLKGQIAQCTPDRSSSSHASYEVTLQTYGWGKRW